MQKAEIYCPKCKWVPPALPLWNCLQVCGHIWDTFETGGVCPKCKEKFDHTQCIECGKLSPHRDWYHYPKKAPKELLEKLSKKTSKKTNENDEKKEAVTT